MQSVRLGKKSGILYVRCSHTYVLAPMDFDETVSCVGISISGALAMLDVMVIIIAHNGPFR